MGGIGLFFAAGYLGMSFQLPFGQLDQPGAGVFPVIVGVMLMLASLTTIWEGWRLDRAEQVEIPVSVARNRLLSLIGLLFAYCLALPWLGQIVSSALFCLLLVRMLSHLHWPRIVAYSLGMSIILYVVFVVLLKVPLPRGMLAF
jgi:putative tricarboxylic transport membrane protein